MKELKKKIVKGKENPPIIEIYILEKENSRYIYNLTDKNDYKKIYDSISLFHHKLKHINKIQTDIIYKREKRERDMNMMC